MSDLDGCGLDMTREVTADDEVDLVVLFVEALDPGTLVTVEQRAAEWKALFG